MSDLLANDSVNTSHDLSNTHKSSMQKFITNSKISNHCIIQALSNSWQLSAANYVQDSSQDTYRTGWRNYLKFCNSLNIDPHLQIVNKDIPINTNFSYCTNILLLFQQSLALFLKTKPSTISNYLSGVKYNFNCLFLPTDGFEDNIIKRVRQSLSIQYKSAFGLQHKQKRLPFTLDMILQARTIISIHNTKDHLAFNAILTGFFLLLRSSQLVHTKSDHHLLSQHVIFLFEANNEIVEIPSHDIHPLTNHGILRGASIFIRSQKNDPREKLTLSTTPIQYKYTFVLSTGITYSGL